MAALNARRVSDLQVTILPDGGCLGWLHAVGGEPPTPGAATLTIGDLPLVVTVLADRGGTDAPAYPAVAIASGYGWRTRLPAPGGRFASPGGVRLSTVLAALSGLVGEAYDVPAEAKLGPAYSWDAGTRGRAVLADLVARGAIQTWRVNPLTGRTRFDAWPTLPAADARGTITHRDLVHGVRYVKVVDSVRAWLPGATVQGARIARTIIREKDSETSLEVWES